MLIPGQNASVNTAFDAAPDAAYCHLCLCAEVEKHFLASTITISDCLAEIQSMTAVQRSFFSEVCSLIHLVLVMPATNTVSDRSLSAMRRLKTYLRRTMVQSCLNRIMLLSICNDRVDNLDVKLIGDEFVCGSEHQLWQFGHFK